MFELDFHEKSSQFKFSKQKKKKKKKKKKVTYTRMIK